MWTPLKAGPPPSWQRPPLQQNPTQAGWVGAKTRRTGSCVRSVFFARNRDPVATILRWFCGPFGTNHGNDPKARLSLDFNRRAGKLHLMTVLTPTPFPLSDRLPEQVCFDRHELGKILAVYGRMVALGEWRDYGLSTLRDLAVFSIFRRTAEFPLYRVEKRPRLRLKQGMYSVVAVDGLILRRGHDLARVLQVLEIKTIRQVD